MGQEQHRALAQGGPLDGTELGSSTPDRYEIRMADATLHLYLRTGEVLPQGVVFRCAGRL